MHPSGSETTETRVGGRHAADRPVFVDASGRRQRRVRRAGRFLAVPAAGYVALLLVSALGGPTVSSPYLPLPEPGDHRGSASPAPDDPGGRHHGPADAGRAGGTRAPVDLPTAPRTTAPPPPAAGSPTPPPRVTTAATPTATVTHGRSRATAHPVPTHTNHGH